MQMPKVLSQNDVHLLSVLLPGMISLELNGPDLALTLHNDYDRQIPLFTLAISPLNKPDFSGREIIDLLTDLGGTLVNVFRGQAKSLRPIEERIASLTEETVREVAARRLKNQEFKIGLKALHTRDPLDWAY